MAIATRNSWKTLPLPSKAERLRLCLLFSDAEGEKIVQGHIPEDFDEKWFISYEDGWLYFHRSWTGACIYGIRLDGSPAGVRVIDAWASRDLDHYNSPGIEADERIVRELIASRLLC